MNNNITIHRNIIPIAIVVIAISYFMVLMKNMSAYPYYFMWDMDQLTALDLMLIQSGYLPDQVHHPSFGMYLFLTLSTSAARLLDILPTISFDDLTHSLNPILPLAEVTDYLRAHSSLLILACGLLMFLFLTIVFDLSMTSPLVLLLFVAAIFQSWGFFHSTMIRSELYALFFWHLALFIVALSSLHRDSAVRISLFLFAGLLLGLAYLTKIQIFPYMLVAVVLVHMVLLLRSADFTDLGRLLENHPLRFYAVIVVSIEIFLIMWVYSSVTPFRDGMFVVGWGVPFGMNFGGWFVLLAAGGLLAMQVAWRHYNFPGLRYMGPVLVALSVISLGFVLSAFLGLLLFTSLETGWYYAIINFKVAFTRHLEIPDFIIIVRKSFNVIKVVIADNYILFLCLLLSFCALAIVSFMAITQRVRTSGLIIFGSLAVSLIIFFLGFPFFRLYLRDNIWHQTLPSFAILTVIAALISFRSSTRDKNTDIVSTTGASILAILLIMSNFMAVSSTILRTKLNFNIFGWVPERTLKHVTSGNQKKYTTLVQQKLPGKFSAVEAGTRAAFRQTLSRSFLKQTVSFVLPNDIVPLTKIGVLAKNHSVSSNRNHRISSFPRMLSNTILVDLADLPDRNIRRIDPDVVNRIMETEVFEKRLPQLAGNLTLILPRRDLRIFLFRAQENDATSQCGGLTVTVDREGQAAAFCGQEVVKYTEIAPVSTGDAFLVIQPRFGF